MDESDSYAMLGIYYSSSTHDVFGASFVNDLWQVRVDDSEAGSGSKCVAGGLCPFAAQRSEIIYIRYRSAYIQ